jgi:hypothetical protein
MYSMNTPERYTYDGLQKKLKAPSFGSILTTIRAKVENVLNINVPHNVKNEVLEACRTSNVVRLRELCTQHSIPVDPVKEVVQLIATVEPSFKDMIFNGVTDASKGYNVYQSEKGIRVQPYLSTVETAPFAETFEDNIHFTAEDIHQLEALYYEFTDVSRYNSLQTVLNFISYVRQVQMKNPHLTIADIYPLYTPDILYNLSMARGSGVLGGTCMDHAYYFVESLRDVKSKEGNPYIAHVTGVAANNMLTAFTEPNAEPSPWPIAGAVLDYSHTSVAQYFTLKPGETIGTYTAGKDCGQTGYIVYEMGVGIAVAPRVYVSTMDGKGMYLARGQVSAEHVDTSEVLQGNTFGLCRLPQASIAPLIHRTIPASAMCVINTDPEENHSEPNGPALRINFGEGLIRLVTTDKSHLQRFSNSKDLPAGHSIFSTEEVHLSDLPLSYTTAGIPSRTAIERRKDSIWYQVKFDFSTYAKHPDLQATVVTSQGATIMNLRDATELFLLDTQAKFSLNPDFVVDMMYIFDHYKEWMEFLYPRKW